MAMPETVLIVDDDEMLRNQLARAMSARGYEVQAAESFEQACHVLVRQPTFAIIDLKMPGASGLDVLQYAQLHSPNTRAIVLTGYGSIANAVEAMRLGAVNYVTKPADADQIIAALREQAEPVSESATPELKRPSLAETEWNHIQRVLADCDGNITHAAKILDIPRRTLQRKLKKRAP